MNPLLCERCGRGIVPGDAVEFVGIDPDDDRRIFLSDELLVVHATCPNPEEGEK